MIRMENELKLLVLRQMVRAVTDKKEVPFGNFVYFGHESSKRDEKHHIDVAWSVLQEAVANDELSVNVRRKPKLDKELELTKGVQYRKLKKRYEVAMQGIIHGAEGYKNKKRYDFQREEMIRAMQDKHKHGEHISPFQILYASGKEKWLGGLSALLAMEYDFGYKHFPLQIMQGFVLVYPSEKFLRTHGLSSKSKIPKVTGRSEVDLTVIKPTATQAGYYWISNGNDFDNKIEVKRKGMWELLYGVATHHNSVQLENNPPLNSKTIDNLHDSPRLKKLLNDDFRKVLRIRSGYIEPTETINLKCIAESTMKRIKGRQTKTST